MALTPTHRPPLNPLLREVAIAMHKLRLRWWRLAEQQMGYTHHDLPHALRVRWDIEQRIKELQNERTQHHVR